MINKAQNQEQTLLALEDKITVTIDKKYLYLKLSKGVKVKEDHFKGFAGVGIKFTYKDFPFKYDFKAMLGDVAKKYGCWKTGEVTYVIIKNTKTSRSIKDFALTFHERAKEIINGNK